MAATVGFGQSALLALVPIISVATGLDAPAIGAIGFLGALAFLAAAPAWGYREGGLRSRFRLLAWLMVGAQLVFLGVLSAGSMPAMLAFALLAGSRIVYSAAAAGVMPQAQAAVVRMSGPEKRHAALARLSAGLSVGRVLGPLVALPGAAGLLPALAVMTVMPLALLAGPDIAPAERQEEQQVERAPRRWDVARAISPLLGVGFALTLGLGQIQITLGLFLQARFGLDAHAAARWSGVTFTLVAVAMIVVQLALVPRLRGGLVGSLRIGLIVFALGSAAAGFAPSLILVMLGAMIAGGGIALATPSYTAWLVGRIAPREQAAAAGWLASVHVLGQGAGALSGGLAFALSPLAPFLICAGLGAAIALALAYIEPPRDHREAS
ncbi:MFS transporter [Bosea sp. 685]|uniref:MFS transporter n=1 Tax=Bosea sp. 685 TaxID=3080057 RepID=UPI0028930CA1|nr:MFS transporter [Bosea sp. 685]WNJ93404.1 MFS transporter [Bosea sp. 685]